MITFIENFENYSIDADGNVYNNITSRKLKPFYNPDGYVLYKLYKDKKAYTLKAHRLVALTFIPNPDNKAQVNHINGNKEDNRVENLEWVTKSENQIHAHKTGLQSKLGERLPCLKISPDCFLLEVFYSKIKASESTGIPRKQIHKSIKNKKLAGGYLWQ